MKFYLYLFLTSWISAILGYELLIVGYSRLLSFRCQYQDKTFATNWWLEMFVEQKLRCSVKDSYGYTVYALYVSGVIIGSITAGLLSDKFGRKRIFIYTTIFHTVGTIIHAIDTFYALYCIGRFIIGFASIGLFLSCYLLMFEYCSSRSRILAVCFFRLPQIFGMVILYGLASTKLRSWHNRDYLLCCFNIVPIIGIFVLPESLRWEKMKALETQIIKIAKFAAANFDIVFKHRFYSKNKDSFRFPYGYGFLMTTTYLPHFAIMLVLTTLLSPEAVWRYEYFALQTKVFGVHYILYTLGVVLIICGLTYFMLIMIKNRKTSLFILLPVAALFYCLNFIKVSDTISVVMFLIPNALLSCAFLIILIVITAQLPTNVRGGVLGTLLMLQVLLFVFLDNLVFAFLDPELYFIAPVVGIVVSLLVFLASIFFNTSEGLVILNTYHDAVKFSQKYQQYMY